MKKKIIIGVAALGLFATSCKKDYTCECIKSYTNNQGITTTDQPDVITFVKVSKEQAKNLCASTESDESYTASSVTVTTNFPNQNSNGSGKSSTKNVCTLTKK